MQQPTELGRRLIAAKADQVPWDVAPETEINDSTSGAPIGWFREHVTSLRCQPVPPGDVEGSHPSIGMG